jgi:hypothetical protein
MLVVLALISVIGIGIGMFTFLNRAVSQQIYTYDCEPSCVAGTWKYAKVNITLSKPVKDKGKTVLSRIDVQTQDPKELLPLLKTSDEGWDLEANSLNG